MPRMLTHIHARTSSTHRHARIYTDARAHTRAKAVLVCARVSITRLCEPPLNRFAKQPLSRCPLDRNQDAPNAVIQPRAQF